MHPSSLNNMVKAQNKISANINKNLIILDVGGAGANHYKSPNDPNNPDKQGSERSYRFIWSDWCKEYYIADIDKGLNVTHHMKNQYIIPIEDEKIDLVVSGQTLEHVKNPFKLIQDMTRVLKSKGYMIIIAPSEGPTHDIIDCWRFKEDSFKAIAEEVGLKVIADWIDHTAPDFRSSKWKDHIFIGQKP